MTGHEHKSFQQENKLIESTMIHPAWWADMGKRLTGIDKKAFIGLREYIGKNGGQRWLYPMSGVDITPIIIGPADAEHTYLDISYIDNDPVYPYGKSLLAEAFQHSFQRLGASVRTRLSWDHALHKKRQDIEVDGKTMIHLVGEDQEDKSVKEIYDMTFDVMYNNAGMQITNLLPQLKVGGLYIVKIPYNSDFDSSSIYEWLIRNEISIGEGHSFADFKDRTLEDFGFVPIFGIPFRDLHFPQVSKNDLVVDKGSAFFQVFQKTREFTQEEKDQLAAVQLLQLMDKRSMWFLTEEVKESKQEYTETYKKIIQEYLQGIKKIFVTSPDLAQKVHSFVEQQNFIRETVEQLLNENLNTSTRRNTSSENKVFQELVEMYKAEKTKAKLPVEFF